MSTRSRIGILREDNSGRSIYCHWDGYLDGVGKDLKEHYNDKDKVNALLDLGDISVLDASIECPKGHCFDNRIEGYTLAYGRDRGETNIDALEHTKVEPQSKHLESFNYRFNVKKGYWQYTCNGKNWRKF